jgi:hypothetical protein
MVPPVDLDEKPKGVDAKFDLTFRNPTFQPESEQLESCCVLGPELARGMGPGSVFSISGVDKQPEASHGIVFGVAYQPFEEGPMSWISRHHDPAKQSRLELARGMKSTWGSDFGWEKFCTFVLFRSHQWDQ